MLIWCALAEAVRLYRIRLQWCRHTNEVPIAKFLEVYCGQYIVSTHIQRQSKHFRVNKNLVLEIFNSFAHFTKMIITNFQILLNSF